MNAAIRNSLVALTLLGSLSLVACKTTDETTNMPSSQPAPESTMPPASSTTSPTDNTPTPPTDSSSTP